MQSPTNVPMGYRSEKSSIRWDESQGPPSDMKNDGYIQLVLIMRQTINPQIYKTRKDFRMISWAS